VAVCCWWEECSSNSVQCRGCGEWVYKCCLVVKSLLSTIGNVFVCKVCEGADDINLQESMDLGNGVCIDRVGRFCNMGDMLNGGVNSILVGRVHCAWGKFGELSG